MGMAYAAMSCFFLFRGGRYETNSDAGCRCRSVYNAGYLLRPAVEPFDVPPHRPFRLTALGKVSMRSGKTHGKRAKKRNRLLLACVFANQQPTIVSRGRAKRGEGEVEILIRCHCPVVLHQIRIRDQRRGGVGEADLQPTICRYGAVPYIQAAHTYIHGVYVHAGGQYVQAAAETANTRLKESYIPTTAEARTTRPPMMMLLLLLLRWRRWEQASKRAKSHRCVLCPSTLDNSGLNYHDPCSLDWSGLFPPGRSEHGQGGRSCPGGGIANLTKLQRACLCRGLQITEHIVRKRKTPDVLTRPATRKLKAKTVLSNQAHPSPA